MARQVSIVSIVSYLNCCALFHLLQQPCQSFKVVRVGIHIKDVAVAVDEGTQVVFAGFQIVELGSAVNNLLFAHHLV